MSVVNYILQHPRHSRTAQFEAIPAQLAFPNAIGDDAVSYPAMYIVTNPIPTIKAQVGDFVAEFPGGVLCVIHVEDKAKLQPAELRSLTVFPEVQTSA